MAVLVASGTCPKCKHNEYPIRHTGCFGAWVKQEGRWFCYSCKAHHNSNGPGCICDNCGHQYSDTRTVAWKGSLEELGS